MMKGEPNLMQIKLEPTMSGVCESRGQHFGKYHSPRFASLMAGYG